MTTRGRHAEIVPSVANPLSVYWMPFERTIGCTPSILPLTMTNCTSCGVVDTALGDGTSRCVLSGTDGTEDVCVVFVSVMTDVHLFFLCVCVCCSTANRLGSMGNTQDKPMGAPASKTDETARHQTLGPDYDGVILVSDIDDTLRNTPVVSVVGEVLVGRQAQWEPYDGVLGLFHRVAELGIPIVYLSAAPFTLMAEMNTRFLSRFPRGLLVMNRHAAPLATAQRAYKEATIRKLKNIYQKATLVCLGDNKYMDAHVYGGHCTSRFIRCAQRDQCQGGWKNLTTDVDEIVTFHQYREEDVDKILGNVTTLHHPSVATDALSAVVWLDSDDQMHASEVGAA